MDEDDVTATSGVQVEVVRLRAELEVERARRQQAEAEAARAAEELRGVERERVDVIIDRGKRRGAIPLVRDARGYLVEGALEGALRALAASSGIAALAAHVDQLPVVVPAAGPLQSGGATGGSARRMTAVEGLANRFGTDPGSLNRTLAAMGISEETLQKYGPSGYEP